MGLPDAYREVAFDQCCAACGTHGLSFGRCEDEALARKLHSRTSQSFVGQKRFQFGEIRAYRQIGMHDPRLRSQCY